MDRWGILRLVIFLTCWVAMAIIAGVIAKRKGRSYILTFLFSFIICPPIGLVVALAMHPDVVKIEQTKAQAHEKPDIKEATSDKPEVRDCREAFQAASKVHEKRGTWKLCYLALIIPLGLAACWLVPKFSPKYSDEVDLLCGIWLAGWFVLMFVNPKLKCPACREDVFREGGPFCPECGARSVEIKKDTYNTRICRACGKELRPQVAGRHRHRARNYKIRYCPYCGAYIHTDGI
jgi:hypothetical protein